MPGSGPPVLQCDVLTFRSETTTWSFHLSHICKEPKANLKDRDTKGCICCKCANLSVKPGAYFKEIKQVQLNSSPFGPEDRPKKTSLTSVMLCFALGCFSDAYFGLSQFLLLRSFPRGLETSEIIFFLCMCWVFKKMVGIESLTPLKVFQLFAAQPGLKSGTQPHRFVPEQSHTQTSGKQFCHGNCQRSTAWPIFSPTHLLSSFLSNKCLKPTLKA